MGSIPVACWNFLPPVCLFAWHWARQCTDTRAFILLCSLYFFFLGFRHWQSRADRGINLNKTIWLPLFWRSWTRAVAHTRPRVLAWHMGRNHSQCRAPELTESDRQPGQWLHLFLISRKYRKNKGLVRDFFKAHAPDCLALTNSILWKSATTVCFALNHIIQWFLGICTSYTCVEPEKE